MSGAAVWVAATRLSSILRGRRRARSSKRTELGFAPARTYQKALFDAGIPLASFMVADIEKHWKRLTKLGVVFSTKPTKAGPTTMAVLDDTCGNLIQIFQP